MVVDLKASKRRIRGGALWTVAVLLVLAVAYPAWAMVFAPKNSVVTKSITKNAVTSVKIKDGSIVNADISAAAAIAASKINTAGLNADTVDGKHAADFVAKTGDQAMAGALTAANFQYGAARTRYLSIPASAFTPIDSSTTYTYDTTTGLIWTGGSGHFRAPVELPQGATITKYRFTAFDGDSSQWIEAHLMRWSASGSNEEMAGNSTMGMGTPGWVDLDNSSVATPVIDNSKYSYFVNAIFEWPTEPMQLGSVTITYTLPSP